MHGDNVKLFKSIKDEYIDLTVTSPPYDDLRQYNGYTFNFEEIANELYRVTKVGGIVVWVVADKTHNGSETLTSFKHALYFKSIGFNLHDTMIYHKESQPRQSNRYEQHFEYMFVFSNGKPKTTNLLRIPCKSAGMIKMRSSCDNNSDDRTVSYSVVANTKIKGNVWVYKIGATIDPLGTGMWVHPAIFPEKLAEDHILSWSNPGDIVLDPMMGSGTTGKMAVLNNRRFIGMDCSEQYVNIAARRIEQSLTNPVIASTDL